jgi:hypothetical protein
MSMTIRIVVIFLLIGLVPCAKSQSSFPIIDKETQKMRDNNRRLILEAELQTESGELTEAQKAFGAKPNKEHEAEVHRHVENIKALRRELDGVAGDLQEARTPVRAIVKAMRPAATSLGRWNRSSRFWDPYNRAPETTDFSTTP